MRSGSTSLADVRWNSLAVFIGEFILLRHMIFRSKFVLLAIFFSGFTEIGNLQAQILEPEKIDQKIKELEALPDENKQKASLTHWREIKALSGKQAEAKKQLTEVRKKLNTEVSPPKSDFPKELPSNQNLEQLDQFLIEVQSRLTATQTFINEAQTNLDYYSERKTLLPNLITQAQEKLRSFSIPAESETMEQKQAQQKARYEQQVLQVSLESLLAEKELTEAMLKALPEALKQGKSQVKPLETLQEKASDRIATLRDTRIKKTTASVEDAAEQMGHIPELAGIIESIRELGSDRNKEDGALSQLEEAKQDLAQIKEIRTKLIQQRSDAEKRINFLEKAGLQIDTETGLLLRGQRAKLPSLDDLKAKLKQNSRRKAQSQISYLEVQEALSRLPLNEEKIAEILKENPELTRVQIDSLLNLRDELLTTLSREYGTLSASLSETNAISLETIQEIDDYTRFLDERLLWIKSTEIVSLGEFEETGSQLAQLYSPQMMQESISGFVRQFRSHLVRSLFFVILLLTILTQWKKISGILQTSGEQAVRRNCTSFRPTLLGLGASLLLAGGPALVFYFLSQTFSEPTYLQLSLRTLAIFVFVFGLLYQFSRPYGLFAAHFRIENENAALLLRNLKWFIPVIAPLLFILTSLTSAQLNSSSGRLVYLVAMIPLGIVVHRLFHPSRSILSPGLLPSRSFFARMIYFLAIGLVLSFGLAAALGYFASVMILRVQVGATIGLLFSAFVLTRFLRRWILVSKRNLAVSQALRRREAALAEREAEDNPDAPAPDIPSLEEVKAEAVNVTEVEEQTKRLVKFGITFASLVGLWVIWSSSLPALSVLDSVRIWGTADESAASQDGGLLKNPIISTEEKPEASSPDQEKAEAQTDALPEVIRPSDGRVSLQDLLLSIIFFILTFTAARNIPGLLSLTVFNRINLGHGGNHALTTTVRYLIVLVGVIVALGKIGITWSKVQWIAAAITLGIGFGLQEVFANFVAGIILLYERPIRLGDVVTIGDITGRISQIKIRATTIRQLNNRELVVPNKDFITGQLVNWTLNDAILRVEVPVGVAYGSDTDLVKKTLVQVAVDHPEILDEPKPDVVFTSFGESTLDFKIRGFVADVDRFIGVQSDLHFAVEKAFKEAGIEIAFPQRDLHLRSISPEVNLSQHQVETK